MKRRILMIGLVLIFGLTILQAQFSFDVETGLAFPGYNEVRIPNDANSTFFSLTEDLKADAVFAYRMMLNYRITERSEISFLYAPLTIKPAGNIDHNIKFQGRIFDAEEDISAVYRFDSYRLQYRYHLPNKLWILEAFGLTAKVRDAEITLENEVHTASKYDTGVVPLINFLLVYDVSEKVSISSDGAALASPYGRAADVLTSLNYKYNDKINIKAGYRILEGGSDISEVYTFALFNYALIALQVSL